MKIYHGGYKKIEQPEILTSKYTKDFGRGFYCTILKDQAIRWSRRFDTPIVSIYEYQKNTDLDILEFDRMTEDWLDFIVSCRHGDEHAVHQIAFCTRESLECLRYLDCEEGQQ